MPSELYGAFSQPESLRQGWLSARQGGKTPGVDGVSLERFAFLLDRELAALGKELRGNTYKPWPALRLHLPKPDGGTRAIGVQAVRDRVVQRALLPFLQARIEPLLEEAAFAYRKGRSIEQALTRLEGWRAAGLNWVARTDIRTCFDAIDHDRLEATLRAVVPEDDVRRLILLWLTAGAVDGAAFEAQDDEGLPQGDVLSPLLCNLFLDPFDEAAQRHAPLIRYADDIVLVGRTEADVQAALRGADTALSALGLERNRKKEWVGTFDQGFTFLGAAICGSMRLPLHNSGPGRWHFGYGEPAPAVKRPLARTESALTERFTGLLRADRKGRFLTPMERAFLDAWYTVPHEDRLPEGWQSVYLI